MRALLASDSVQVRRELQSDPEAAVLPFIECASEPPLCCAARAGCNKEIFGLLLEHGADVNATDACGRSPLAVLCGAARRASPSLGPPSQQSTIDSDSALAGIFEVCDVARKQEADLVDRAVLLMAAGADQHLPDSLGATAHSLALASGNRSLATLVQYYDSFQACAALLRATNSASGPDAAASMPIGQLPIGLMTAISAFLVPNSAEEALRGKPGLLAGKAAFEEALRGKPGLVAGKAAFEGLTATTAS